MIEGAHDSIKRTARLAGGLYLTLVPLGLFSFAYVPAVLYVSGDAAATSRNILASEWLFRLGIASHLISEVIVVFLALAMYRLLATVKREHAVLMVVMALLCVPISFVAEVNQLAALRLLNGGGAGLAATQLHTQTMLFLESHRSGVLLAQVFWAVWLVALGSLVLRSRFLPKLVGIGVLVAAAGYLFDSVAYVLLPGRATIGQFTAVGELLLPLWLLIKGVSVEPANYIESGSAPA